MTVPCRARMGSRPQDQHAVVDHGRAIDQPALGQGAQWQAFEPKTTGHRAPVHRHAQGARAAAGRVQQRCQTVRFTLELGVGRVTEGKADTGRRNGNPGHMTTNNRAARDRACGGLTGESTPVHRIHVGRQVVFTASCRCRRPCLRRPACPSAPNDNTSISPLIPGFRYWYGLAPCVLGQLVEVQGCQLGGIGPDRGLDDQRLQALLGRGVALVVQAVELERLHDVGDVGAGRRAAGVVGAVQHVGHDEGGQHTDDDQHHHQLDQGETPRHSLLQTDVIEANRSVFMHTLRYCRLSWIIIVACKPKHSVSWVGISGLGFGHGQCLPGLQRADACLARIGRPCGHRRAAAQQRGRAGGCIRRGQS